jgi:hypothetical protein
MLNVQPLFWIQNEKDYAVLKSLNPVPPVLSQSDYVSWARKGEEHIKKALSQGVVLVKINVDPEEFIGWMQEKGERFNWTAMGDFALLKSEGKFGEG